MFVKGLPEELNPGRVHLRPLDRAVRFAIPCDACGEFSPKRIIVSCGHVFCNSCCTTWRTAEGSRFHCVICNERCDGEISELAESILRRLRFACGCNFEGTLEEIREHAWNDDNADNHRLREEVTNPPESVREDNIINGLCERLQILLAVRHPPPERAKAYFCVELQSKINNLAIGGEPRNHSGVNWTAAGYPVSFFCELRLDSGKSFLGVFIRMRKDQPSSCSWPMKKDITFVLYNRKGEPVKRSSLTTFREGEPRDQRFTMACNQESGFGFPNFFPIEDLTASGANILCNGHACVSLEFKDL